MSSIPMLLDLIDELDSYNPSYFGNDFGLGLHPHHIHRPAVQQRRRYEQPSSLVGYTLPLGLLGRLNERQLGRAAEQKEARQLSNIGKDGFQVCMDVAQFKPNELNVKVVDNAIVVEGKHEEREDEHGYIQRHFVRRYSLPKGYNADQVVSTLSSDGVLTVNVPKPAIEDKSNERVIQIQQTGPAHLNIKQNDQEKVGDGANGQGNAADK